MSSLLVKRNGNRWLSEDFYNIRAFHSPAQKRNGGVGSMGSGDPSRCMSYFLSWGNEEQVSATTTTKSLARVLRRRGVLQTGALEMASHPHTGREMPLEELLALYGYDMPNALIQQQRQPGALTVGLPDITLNKDHLSKDLFSREDDGEEEVQSLADDLTPSVASDNSDILQCRLRAHSLTSGDKDISVSSSDEDDDSDSASVPSNDSHKDIMVGPQYQATIPPLSMFSYQDRAYESEDQLLWTPEVLAPSDVEKFLLLAQRRWGQGQHEDAMATDIVKDNEQVLYELVKCNFNAEEALRRLHFNVKVFNEELCAWSEEECRNFEHGYRVHGKNFHLIQANKVRTRSVGECVEYYYLWKKSERHDFFIQQTTRLGRRKYNIQSGNIDDGEQDGEVAELERSSSSNSHSSSHTSTGQSNTPSPSPDLEKQEESQGRPRRKRTARFLLKP
ncbi:mesoderm induction early response protein 2 isoform X1 [Alosa pseudoharengus]|uniref:mesoderm induction early response protein 2 isoform X1 n=1 Tax=Alosa pseudoharengus TaxID=34774 RepID=UPI003F8CB38F